MAFLDQQDKWREVARRREIPHVQAWCPDDEEPIPPAKGLAMKVRNVVAAVLLLCQCGCGHTYFAWNKPLPVEQTEVNPLPTPGLLDWRGSDYSALGFGNSYDRKGFRRDMDRHVRKHFPGPKR